MFMHVFGYRLKCLIRDRETVFWTLIFSLLLATLFYFAFGHLTIEQERFEPVKTVVVGGICVVADFLRMPVAQFSKNSFLSGNEAVSFA